MVMDDLAKVCLEASKLMKLIHVFQIIRTYYSTIYTKDRCTHMQRKHILTEEMISESQPVAISKDCSVTSCLAMTGLNAASCIIISYVNSLILLSVPFFMPLNVVSFVVMGIFGLL